MPNSIEKLYGSLSQSYDLGDFNTFQTKMANPDSRRKLYDAVSKTHSLGEYDIYEQKVLSALPSNGNGRADVGMPALEGGAMEQPKPTPTRGRAGTLPPMPAGLTAAPETGGIVGDRTPSEMEQKFDESFPVLAKGVMSGIYGSVAAWPLETTAATLGFLRRAFTPSPELREKGAFTMPETRLEKWSREAAGKMREKAEEYQMPEDLQGKNLWDNPEMLLDPRFTAFGVGNMLPSFVVAMIPGVATARLGRGAQILASGLTAGSMEAASTYRETLERGESEDEAFKNMLLMTIGTGGLNAIGFDRIFRKYEGKKLIQATGAAIVEAITEYLEEPLEATIMGLPRDEFIEQMKQGLSVLLPAAFMGGGGSAMFSATGKPQNKHAEIIEEYMQSGAAESLREQVAATLQEQRMDETAQPVTKDLTTEAEAVIAGADQEALTAEQQQALLDQDILDVEGQVQEEAPQRAEAIDAIPEAGQEEIVAQIAPDAQERAISQPATIEDIPVARKAFLSGYVRELGSWEKVLDRFPGDSAEEVYARQRAEDVFGKQPVEPETGQVSDQMVEDVVPEASGIPVQEKAAEQESAPEQSADDVLYQTAQETDESIDARTRGQALDVRDKARSDRWEAAKKLASTIQPGDKISSPMYDVPMEIQNVLRDGTVVTTEGEFFDPASQLLTPGSMIIKKNEADLAEKIVPKTDTNVPKMGTKAEPVDTKMGSLDTNIGSTSARQTADQINETLTQLRDSPARVRGLQTSSDAQAKQYLKSLEAAVNRWVPEGENIGEQAMDAYLKGDMKKATELSEAAITQIHRALSRASALDSRQQMGDTGVQFMTRPGRGPVQTETPVRSDTLPRTGMGALKVQAAVDRLQPKFNIPIRVVGSELDLEGEIGEAARIATAKGDIVSGYYDPNAHEIVLLGDNIRSEGDLSLLVLPHEIAHYGVEGVLGEKNHKLFLTALQKDALIAPEIKALIKKFGWKPDYAASEWWAMQAEGKDIDNLKKSPLWQRALQHLWRFIRNKFRGKDDKILFTKADLHDMLVEAVRYAKQPEALINRNSAGGDVAMRTTSMTDALRQLKDIYRALEELPPVRNGLPTDNLRARLEAKAKELEAHIVDNAGVSFRITKDGSTEAKVETEKQPLMDSRLQKTIAALEKNLPEEGKDRFMRMRMSALINKQIDSIGRGHKLGQADYRDAVFQTKRLIIEYARRNLPKEGITRGQISPLLTALRDASKIQDVANAFNRIDNVLRNVTVKSLQAKFDTLLNRTKPKVKDAKISGKYVADVQSVIEKIRTASAMKAADVEIAIDNIAHRLGAENAAAAEKRELTPELADSDRAEVYILSTFGDIKHKSQDDLQKAVNELKALMDTGRTLRAIQDETRQEVNRERTDYIVPMLGGTKTQEQLAKAGGPKKIGAIRQFIQANLNFEYIMDELSGGEKGSAPLRGFLNRTFMPKIRRSRNAETAGIRTGLGRMQAKAQEIWGAKNSKQLAKEFAKNTIVEDTGITIVQNGETVPLLLSQEQAYKKWQEWQDPSTHETFEKMGYTPETIEQLEKWLDPRVKQWAEWQLYEWYPEYYHSVNEVFREIYGIDLPYNPMYTPLARVYEEGYVADDQLLTDSRGWFAAVRSKHLLSRTKNTRALKNVGGDQMLIQHLVEMEHFKAWASTIRELRGVFGDSGVRTAIHQNFGTHMLQKVDEAINDMARGGIDPIHVNGRLDKMRKNFTTAVLGLNLTLIPKQIVSFPAYWAEIPTTDFFGGVIDFTLGGFRKAIPTLMQSEMMKARYETGFERDIMLAMQRNESQMIAGKGNWRNITMLPTKFGDAVAILAGGWGVYKYHYNQAIKAKKGEAEAHRIAIEEFEAATLRSQQAGNVEDLPSIMRGSSVARLFTMFQTAPNSYFRIEYNALANLARGRGSKASNAKRFMISHFVLPMLFQFVASGFRWDDDRQLRAAILGSLNGLLVVGDWLERGIEISVSALQGRKAFVFNEAISNPVFDNFADFSKWANRFFRQVGGGMENLEWKEITKTIDMLAEVVSKFKGIPYPAASRTVEGLIGAAQGETDMRMLIGYSKYALTPTASDKTSANTRRSGQSVAPRRLPRSRISDRR